jgi:hypothetical protein
MLFFVFKRPGQAGFREIREPIFLLHDADLRNSVHFCVFKKIQKLGSTRSILTQLSAKPPENLRTIDGFWTRPP